MKKLLLIFIVLLLLPLRPVVLAAEPPVQTEPTESSIGDITLDDDLLVTEDAPTDLPIFFKGEIVAAAIKETFPSEMHDKVAQKYMEVVDPTTKAITPDGLMQVCEGVGLQMTMDEKCYGRNRWVW